MYLQNKLIKYAQSDSFPSLPGNSIRLFEQCSVNQTSVKPTPYLEQSAGLRMRYGTSSLQENASNFMTALFAASLSTKIAKY